MQKFPDQVKQILLKSGCVEKVTDSQVAFTAEFKIKAVRANLDGKSPEDIFILNGIDPSLFLPGFPKKTLARWKKIFERDGENGLRSENRGKDSTGRPKRQFDPNDVKSLQERVALLEAENFILKKLRALATENEKKKRSR